MCNIQGRPSDPCVVCDCLPGILIIGYNIKGGSKSFSLQSALRSSYKAFQPGVHRSMTKKSTKKLYSSSTVYFVRKNASSRPLYKWNIDKTRLAGCQDRRELTTKYGQDGEQERLSFSNEMEVAKLSAPPNLEVRYVSCNESAKKRCLSSELEETVF